MLQYSACGWLRGGFLVPQMLLRTPSLWQQGGRQQQPQHGGFKPCRSCWIFSPGPEHTSAADARHGSPAAGIQWWPQHLPLAPLPAPLHHPPPSAPFPPLGSHPAHTSPAAEGVSDRDDTDELQDYMQQQQESRRSAAPLTGYTLCLAGCPITPTLAAALHPTSM